MSVPERRAEGLPSPERIHLVAFSPVLALKFARGDISISSPEHEESPIPDLVHASVITSFTHQQQEERARHWEAKGMSFGEQMQEWVNGESGIVAWMQRQQDTDVQKFIEKLLPQPQEQQKELYQQELAPLLSVISKNGWNVRFEELTPAQIAGLHLYRRFFTEGENGISRGINELGETAREIARQVYGNDTFDKAREILEKITPLMSMFGEKAQVAFAAITDAQMRLQYPDEVQKLNGFKDQQDLQLTTMDQNVLNFLRGDVTVGVIDDKDDTTIIPPAPSDPDIESSEEN